MEVFLQPAAWLTALGIFVLRVMDMSMDTLRMLFVVRGRKGLAWILGAMQSFIIIMAISSVLTGDLNPLAILGYATGFATGNVVGMLIEERLAIGFSWLTIISSTRGALIGEELRKSGFGVTEVSGRGKDGAVTVLHVSARRKEAAQVEKIVLENDPSAFITSEDVRPLRRGFWRS